MKINIKNLGKLKKAEFELGDFTIICGDNNTGKTYATYALYGFLDYWRNSSPIEINRPAIDRLLEEGRITVRLADYQAKASEFLRTASRKYSKSEILTKVFAAQEKLFKETVLSFKASAKPKKVVDARYIYGSMNKNILKIEGKGDSEFDVSLMIDKENQDEFPMYSMLPGMIGDAVKDALFADSIPKPFIASSERTGATIFQKELDFNRNRLIDFIGDKTEKFHPMDLLGKFSSDYPVPVKKNVDFIRDFEPGHGNPWMIFHDKSGGMVQEFC